MEQDTSSTPRRRFVVWLIRGFLSIWGIGIAWVVAAFLNPPETRRSIGERTLDAGSLDSLQVGQGRLVRHREEPIFVVRTSEEGVIALSAVCTHLHCILRLDDEEERLICPCHRGAFDLSGNAVAGPPPRALRRYTVDIQLGRILVHLYRAPGGEA